MSPQDYRCECGHRASQHTDDTKEQCTVVGCRCRFFVHDEQSWTAFAREMAGYSDELLAAVERSLSDRGRNAA